MINSYVTIVIPVYNGESHIKEAINSVLTQTESRFILIILDNDSTDATSKIATSFKDKRIRYIKNDYNIGMLPNWRKALSLAETKYVSILFADDMYKPNFLEKTIAIMENNANVASVSVGSEIIDDSSNRVILNPLKKTGYIKSHDYYVYSYILVSVPPPSQTILRNEVVKKVNGYDMLNLNWIVDVDLLLKITKEGFDVYHLKDILSYRRKWSKNSTNLFKYSYRNFEDRYYLLRAYYEEKLISNDAKSEAYYNVWLQLIPSILINMKKFRFKEVYKQFYILLKNDDNLLNKKKYLAVIKYIGAYLNKERTRV